MAKIVIYPRGFVGPIIEKVQVSHPTEVNNISIAKGTISLVLEHPEHETRYDNDIVELYKLYNSDRYSADKFAFRERLLECALQRFTYLGVVNSFKGFLAVQVSKSPKITLNHLEVFKGILNYLKYNELPIRSSTWNLILTDPITPPITKTDARLFTDYVIQFPLPELDDIVKTLALWMSRENGTDVLLQTLCLLYGKTEYHDEL